MSGFYTLTGTLLTDLGLVDIHNMLQAHALDTVLLDDELEIKGQANLTFRTGFDHEFILAGDSLYEDILMAETSRLSLVLSQLKLTHAIEIYGPNNELIFEDQYQF